MTEPQRKAFEAWWNEHGAWVNMSLDRRLACIRGWAACEERYAKLISDLEKYARWMGWEDHALELCGLVKELMASFAELKGGA